MIILITLTPCVWASEWSICTSGVAKQICTVALQCSVLEKLLVPQLITKFLTLYMGSQGLLGCSQGSATFNPEPDASSPHPANLCL